MKKLYIHCLAYNSLNLVEDAIELFEQQKGKYPIERKLLVDPKYPLTRNLTQEQHSHRLMKLAANYGWDYARITNEGVSGNWQASINIMGLGEGDALYGCDGDGRPCAPGYLDAMMDVLNNDPTCYTVQFNVPGTYVMQLPRNEFKVGETNVIQYRQLTAWSLGIFDCGWIKRIGGLKQWHPLYSYIEHATNEAAEKLGGRWLILRDHFDQHLQSDDKEYVSWKRECAEQKTGLEFSAWLKERHAD